MHFKIHIYAHLNNLKQNEFLCYNCTIDVGRIWETITMQPEKVPSITGAYFSLCRFAIGYEIMVPSNIPCLFRMIIIFARQLKLSPSSNQL